MPRITIEQHAVQYSTSELCDCCTVDSHCIEEFVELGIIEPDDINADQWQFSMDNYLRLRKALRLGQDLDINPPGLALVFDLMDQIEQLQQQLNSRNTIKTNG